MKTVLLKNDVVVFKNATIFSVVPIADTEKDKSRGLQCCCPPEIKYPYDAQPIPQFCVICDVLVFYNLHDKVTVKIGRAHV